MASCILDSLQGNPAQHCHFIHNWTHIFWYSCKHGPSALTFTRESTSFRSASCIPSFSKPSMFHFHENNLHDLTEHAIWFWTNSNNSMVCCSKFSFYVFINIKSSWCLNYFMQRVRESWDIIILIDRRILKYGKELRPACSNNFWCADTYFYKNRSEMLRWGCMHNKYLTVLQNKEYSKHEEISSGLAPSSQPLTLEISFTQ